MAVINTGSFPKALWPGIKQWWGEAYNEHPEEFVFLFDKETSDKNYEEYVQQTGFGLAAVKTEGSGTQYDSAIQGYTTRLTNVAYGLGFIVTREEEADNLYEKVSKSRAKALAFSFRQAKENILANVYNRAFNSAYTGGDGVSMINVAHPNTSGGTWSNKPTVDTDLSEVALEDAAIAIMGFTNDRGLLINVMPKSLLIPRQESFNAARILKSLNQSGTANNDLNILRATNTIPDGAIMNHYFSDPNAWFVRTNVPGLVYQEREAISFTQDNDFDTDNHKYKGYERYTAGWYDPRAIYGSAGA